MASEPTLSSLAALAATTADSVADGFGVPDDFDTVISAQGKTKEQLRRHYIRSLHKVIDESDVVVLVLDARDPEGCRSRLVEEEVRRREHEGKRLVLVLNKIGLWCLISIFITYSLAYRPCSPRQRPGMATVFATFDTDVTISVSLIEPKEKPCLAGRTCSPAPAQSI